MGADEQTFIMIKPDGVQRGLVGKIVERFETRGFKLVAMKFEQPSLQKVEKHYADLAGKPFFPGMCAYMSSGPVVTMVWEGLNAVAMGRKMLGATMPADSEPGTIRGDFCLDVGRNLCHGSDAVESAKAEIALWFHPKDLVCWNDHSAGEIYEKPVVAVAAAPAPKKEPAAKKEAAPKKEAAKKEEVAAAVDPVKEAEKAAKDAAKLLAKAIKEGGKKGVELEGASDMGGLEFFCTQVDTPDGDMMLLEEAVKAMNAESDPTEEERKGGAGHIGKIVFSAGAKQLIMVAYVPEDKQPKVNATEWLTIVAASVGGAVTVSQGPGYAIATADGDSEMSLFPIKMKDTALSCAINYLKERGCFPDQDDSDGDDPVFGDDAFDDIDNM
mmetsp:Transcript_31724/g.79233  ORF Transcript_31724/g.79233 Transcript_31724/m.79233 type:complete len:384 (+) Transcript_31724:49-1200(+)